MIEIEDEINFIAQLKANSNRDMLVLFYSSWCPFCRSFQPVFEKYSEKDNSKIYLKVLLNDDDNSIWETYSIQAVPTVLLFNNNKITKRLDCQQGIGLNETKLTNWLKNNNP